MEYLSNYWLNKNKNIAKEERIKKRNYKNSKFERQARNSLYSSQLKIRATKEEIIAGDILWKNGVKFIFQKGFLSPFHRIVDFYIPKRRLIIEIDGGYHKEIKEKDDYKDMVWKNMKFKTFRITNEEVLEGIFEKKLKQFIGIDDFSKF